MFRSQTHYVEASKGSDAANRSGRSGNFSYQGSFRSVAESVNTYKSHQSETPVAPRVSLPVPRQSITQVTPIKLRNQHNV